MSDYFGYCKIAQSYEIEMEKEKDDKKKQMLKLVTLPPGKYLYLHSNIDYQRTLSRLKCGDYFIFLTLKDAANSLEKFLYLISICQKKKIHLIIGNTINFDFSSKSLTEKERAQLDLLKEIKSISNPYRPSGRPSLTSDDLPYYFCTWYLAKKRGQKVCSITELAKQYQVTRGTIYRWKKVADTQKTPQLMGIKKVDRNKSINIFPSDTKKN